MMRPLPGLLDFKTEHPLPLKVRAASLFFIENSHEFNQFFYLITASKLGEGEISELNIASSPEAIIGLNLLSTETYRKLFLLLSVPLS